MEEVYYQLDSHKDDQKKKNSIMLLYEKDLITLYVHMHF